MPFAQTPTPASVTVQVGEVVPLAVDPTMVVLIMGAMLMLAAVAFAQFRRERSG